MFTINLIPQLATSPCRFSGCPIFPFSISKIVCNVAFIVPFSRVSSFLSILFFFFQMSSFLSVCIHCLKNFVSLSRLLYVYVVPYINFCCIHPITVIFLCSQTELIFNHFQLSSLNFLANCMRKSISVGRRFSSIFLRTFHTQKLYPRK